MKKLIICGNYGAGNLGDEAILRALIQKFEVDNEITVMSASPEETAKKFNVKTIPRVPSGARSLLKGIFHKPKEITKAIKECDRFILGGGTLLTDEPWQSMMIWGAQIESAFKYKKPIEIYASGIGPFKWTWAKHWATSILKRANKVTVRDERSKHWVEELGRSDVQVIPDPVFRMAWDEPETMPKVEKNTIIIVPRFWAKNADKTLYSFKKFVQYLCLKKGKNVIAIPFEKGSKEDLCFLSKIFEQEGLTEKVSIAPEGLTEDTVIAMMKQSEIVIGMRLHSLIFASLAKAPSIGISYMEKVRGVLETLESPPPIIDIEDLSFEALKQAYENAS